MTTDRTYVVTGSASGMGRAATEKFRATGHTVIGIDLKSADVIADLSTAEGRRTAAATALAACDGVLDGAVLAAGLGPIAGRQRLIAQVNYFGVVELLMALRPALARADRAKVVVIGSNSTTTTPLVPQRAIRALLAGDADRALRAVRPKEAKAIKVFPVPIGGYGDPSQLADWMVFMLSDAADFMCGSVVFVDGGSDAYFRADSWPTAVPAISLPRYLTRFLRHRQSDG
ncbi:MAG: NAD-dependent epimerase [Mycolicibacter algericus]|uniref:SDR family oxidoreductase n=1 Tax=Mycolicibacter algericus TaxID=1288388 RepID=UPI003C725527